MSGRVLFHVPNALNTRQPMPVPGGPSGQQLATIGGIFFGGIVWMFTDLWFDRDMWTDLKIIGWLAIVALVFAFKRPYGHHLLYWFVVMNRQIWLRLYGRLSWGVVPPAPGDVIRDLAPGGSLEKGAVLISGPWTHAIYTNAKVEDDGIVDVSGLPIPFMALFIGRAPFRAIIQVMCSQVGDLYAAVEQEAILSRRARMWYQLGFPASAHVVIDPLDPETIAYCAGPDSRDARALAQGTLDGMQQGLIERNAYLVIPGATRGLLRGRVEHAVNVLAQAGRDPVMCSRDQANVILDREWGESRRRPLAITADWVRIAGKQWVSFFVNKIEREAPLDVLAPLLDGSLHARVGLYSWPIGVTSAKHILKMRDLLWSAAMGEGGRDYTEAHEDAEIVQTEVRNQGSLHHMSLVVTVAIEEKEDAEKLLRTGYVEHSSWYPASRRQDAAARSALPLGLPQYLDRGLINGGTLGMLTPWTGSGLWVPPGVDGKPHAVLVGTSMSTAEVVGHDLFDESIQDAWSVFVWGMMGAGKTVSMEVLAKRICQPHPNHYLAELKPRLFVIDQKEDFEWGPLVKHLGGQYIVADSWQSVKGINVEQPCLGVNVSRIPIHQRGRFVDELLQLQWDLVARRATSEPWPGVVVVDEMSALAMSRRGRELINRLGKMARSAWWAVMFGTQDLDDVLRHDETAGHDADGLVAAAIKNAPTRIALRQPTMDKELLASRLRLPDPALEFLMHMGGEDGARNAGSTRGQCLLWAQGRSMPIATQVVVLPHERPLFAMNPQRRRQLVDGERMMVAGDPADDRRSVDRGMGVVHHRADRIERLSSSRGRRVARRA